MRRFLCIVLTGVMLSGCLCTNVGAAGELDVVSEKYDTEETAITRATGTFDCTIMANSNAMLDKKFSLAAGETVQIRANYSPESASMDFGLLDSDGVYHYVNVATGNINVTIEVPENGSYTFVMVNNSNNSVKVNGIVRY